MKKKYITPHTSCVSSECEPLMAGSGELDKFNPTPTTNPTNPAVEGEVTSKHHTLWDTTWEDDEEE